MSSEFSLAVRQENPNFMINVCPEQGFPLQQGGKCFSSFVTRIKHWTPVYINDRWFCELER